MILLDVSVTAFTSFVALYDVSERRIPNWLILTGVTAAIIINLPKGIHGLSQSVLGFAIGVSLLVIPFALGWLGAGDVKAFAVIGALLGPAWLPRIAFYTAVVAGLIGAGYVVVNRLHLQGFKVMWTDFRLAIASFGHIFPEHVTTSQAKQRHYMPWAVALGAGTIIAYYLDPQGRWAGF
ncbi:MAG TPA: prepilin peptidase [Candidatus Eisenbacteria bacterium]|nr:prepilin peptidase [Candidatus Eisenbacteria bacterium]